MSIPSVESIRAKGRQLAERGLTSSVLVTDLDETVWDWASPVVRQPLLAFAHIEWIHVRRYLTALLEGIVLASDQVPVRVWTAGYGYRIDRVCQKIPALGRALGAGRGLVPSEDADHMCTRTAFLRALDSAPHLVGDAEGIRVSSKLPGMPAEAGRPLVDESNILLDDRLTNCQHFIDGHPDRMAIHLVGAQRQWKKSISKFRPWTPKERTWTPDIVDALDAFLGGTRGVVEAHPQSCERAHHTVKVALPHPIAYREWIKPGNRVRKELDRLRAES